MSNSSIKRFLYSLAIGAYTTAIHLAAPFHEKAKKWVRGRVGLKNNLLQWRLEHPGSVYWVHAASLGEFEMALPLMQRIKSEKPECKILLSFFSPSGYEIRKNHPLPDGIFYLLPDTPQNASWFIQNVKPDVAIFIKYEIWLNYLFALREARIPSFLVNAVFRKEQRFFKKNSLFLQGLSTFNHICVQYPDSESLLRKHHINQVSTTGDMRFDRVRQIAQENEEVPIIAAFKNDAKLIIGGSTWAHEESILAEAMMSLPDWKLALFPHEFTGNRKQELRKIFAAHNPVFWTENSEFKGSGRVFIINTVGMLAKAYRYADAAFVGGGFSGKLHNILEPAAYGVPIFTGPKTERFEEAQKLEQSGSLHKIRDGAELAHHLSSGINAPKTTWVQAIGSVTEKVWGVLSENMH